MKRKSLGLNNYFGFESELDSESLKRKTYTSDFYNLMDKQNNKCADTLCAKRHGKKQSVSTTRDLDHIFPIRLWELTKKKGNPNDISNLQLLCPDCHRIKTAHDKKQIAEFKKKKGGRTTNNSEEFVLNPKIKPVNMKDFKF